MVSYRTDLIDNINYPPFDETEPENSLKRQIALSKYPRTILRGAGNLYFPIVFKGVCLPKSGYSTSIPDDLVVSLKRFYPKDGRYWLGDKFGQGIRINFR